VPLLDGAPRVLVIEDDHAGSVSGAPPHSLCDRGRERWAVVRSVSKALGPDLRLAVVSGDATTIARLEGRQQLGAGWVSHVLQSLVVALWQDPQVEALLESATAAYRDRREALIRALARVGMTAHGRSGLNVWVPVPDEAAATCRLMEAGWAVSTGEQFRFRAPAAIRISIGSLLAGEAESLAEVLARPDRRAQHTRSA
jgi:DNA-binding transcriptional MocR family regulator